MGSQPSLATPPQLPTPVPVTPPLSPPAVRRLPPQPSLEQLKKQAKDLLAAVLRGDGAALERFARCFPASAAEAEPRGARDAPPPTLAQAQLVIAREYGSPSWPRLRQAVELAPLRALLERSIARPIDWPARRRNMEALAAAGPAGMQVALEALSDPNPKLRGAALGFIDHHATDACVPQLSHVAQTDPDPVVRRLAVHALICDRCKPSPLQLDPLPVLLDAFRKDPNRRVRFSAALSFWPYRDFPEVQNAFRVAAREDPSSLVRRAAVNGLSVSDALPLLAHIAQTDPDAHVRVAAAQKLGRGPYVQLACQVLEAALRESGKPQVQHDAHQALKRLSPEYRQLAAQRAREASLGRAGGPPHQWRKRRARRSPTLKLESAGTEPA